MRLWGATVFVGLAILAAVGCTGDPDAVAPADGPTTADGATTLPTRRELAPNGDPADLRTVLLKDLAARLGISVGEIDVVTFCTVTWPDGSIGAATPGRLYTQARGKTYRYHGTADGFIAVSFEPGLQVDMSVGCP